MVQSQFVEMYTLSMLFFPVNHLFCWSDWQVLSRICSHTCYMELPVYLKCFYAAYRGNDYYIDLLKIFIRFLNISPMAFFIILTLSCFFIFPLQQATKTQEVTDWRRIYEKITFKGQWKIKTQELRQNIMADTELNFLKIKFNLESKDRKRVPQGREKKLLVEAISNNFNSKITWSSF